MSTEMTIGQTLPDFAKDVRINLVNALSAESNPGLNDKQIAMVALSSAYALKNMEVVRTIEKHFASTLSETEINAAKAAATLMAMNNVYYRFTHLVDDKEYQSMPAGLRMSVMGSPGVPKVDFELCALAVSALNGCGTCMNSHAEHLVSAGISKETVRVTVRIAAVMASYAQATSIKE